MTEKIKIKFDYFSCAQKPSITISDTDHDLGEPNQNKSTDTVTEHAESNSDPGDTERDKGGLRKKRNFKRQYQSA